MISRIALCFSSALIVFVCFLGVNPLFSEQYRSNTPESLDEIKSHIIEDIEISIQELRKSRDCVSASKTQQELEICMEELKIRRFQEVQGMLDEMGMSREERRMRRLPE